MDWTPEAVKAQMEYRRGDLVTMQQIREARRSSPSWWQRLRQHRSQQAEVDDGKEQHRAA
jgi:hypothetical protein